MVLINVEDGNVATLLRRATSHRSIQPTEDKDYTIEGDFYIIHKSQASLKVK